MRWLVRLLHESRAHRQLDSELRFHLEQQISDYIASGLSPDEARRRARLDFGGLDQVKEQVHASQRGYFLETLIQDIRYGLRMLRKSPGFTVVAVLTLALGIGANTAIFSVVNTLVLRPLPFNDSDRVLIVWWGLPARDLPGGTATLEVAADYTPGKLNVAGADGAEQISAAEVSQNFFRVFSINPLLGRTFSASEEMPGHPPVVILSKVLWDSQFHADPKVLHKTLLINGKRFTPIGVFPDGFDFPNHAQAWFPMPVNAADTDFGGNAFMRFQIGRLRTGKTLAEARSEMALIQKREWKSQSSVAPPRVETLHQYLVGDTRQALLLLAGAVALVLLIACADVANLLLARGAARGPEVAVRKALGATRTRLIRQFLAESVLLSLLGGAFGLLFAAWAIRAASVLIPARTAFAAPVSLDGRVLAFTCLLAIATGVVAGLVPAFRSSEVDLSEALKEGARSSRGGFRFGSHRGMRNLFGIAEIASALILAIGATLFLRSLDRLLDVNPGFQTKGVLVARLSLLGPKYAQSFGRATFFEQVRDRVRSLPGVRDAAFVNDVPLGSDILMGMNVTIAGAKQVALPSQLGALYMSVTPDYFRTMGIPVLAGRDFTESDANACAPPAKRPPSRSGAKPCSSAPQAVAILSESLASAAWPRKSAVGEDFWLGSPSDPPTRVVGVVGDVRTIGLSDDATPAMYFPVAQEPPNDASLVVCTDRNPLGLAASVRQAVRDVDPDEPVSSFGTMEGLLSSSVERPRFRSVLLGVFGGLALLLACVGVYGVIAYTVAQRTHEIGVRVALGATRQNILTIVALYGLQLAAAGLGAGLLGAVLLARVASSFLYGVRPGDPLSFALGSAAIAVVILAASYVPARRAMRVDPIVALRHE